MEFMMKNLLRRMSVAACIVMAICAVSLLFWRLGAQEPTVAVEKTTSPPIDEKSTFPSSPQRVAGLQNTEKPPMPEISEATSGTAPRIERPAARGMFSTSTMPPPPTEIAQARFEATIYKVEISQNRIAALDVQALESQASNQVNLMNALKEFGETKVLNRISQSVNLFGEIIKLNEREVIRDPLSQNVQPGNTPRPGLVYSAQSIQTGLNVNISANAAKLSDKMERLCVQLVFQLSTFEMVEVLPKGKLPRIISVNLEHSGTPKFGKPTVLTSVIAPSIVDKEHSMVYVICYVFNETK